MTRIGTNQLITSVTLLIPEGEDATIPVMIGNWQFDLTVKFDNSKDTQGITIEPSGNGAKVTFQKWDNGIGTALKQPGKLADLSDGRLLLFMACNYSIGGTNRLDLQLLLEGGA